MDETPPCPELSQAEQVPPSQKRQIDSNSDDEPLTKRAQLTRKNLALFDKIGKKKTSNPSNNSGSTKTLSTTAPYFDVQAYKNGILDPLDSRPPKTLEDIRKRLSKTRATASPPESVYGRYIDVIGEADNEATIVVKVSGKLLKEHNDKGYKRVFN